MPSQIAGRKPKPAARSKGSDARSLKRKRDGDDLEKLQESVNSLVNTLFFPENVTNTYSVYVGD